MRIIPVVAKEKSTVHVTLSFAFGDTPVTPEQIEWKLIDLKGTEIAGSGQNPIVPQPGQTEIIITIHGNMLALEADVRTARLLHLAVTATHPDTQQSYVYRDEAILWVEPLAGI